MAAGGAIALSDDGVCLGIRGATIHGVEYLRIRQAHVSQFGSLHAGEHILVRGATPGNGKYHLIREAREPHDLGFAGADA
jgi:hypothetical protein